MVITLQCIFVTCWTVISKCAFFGRFLVVLASGFGRLSACDIKPDHSYKCSQIIHFNIYFILFFSTINLLTDVDFMLLFRLVFFFR